MCPLENCLKEYLYFSSLKKHLARNHTKSYWEKYAKWSKDEILKEKEDMEIDSEVSEEFVGEERKISSVNNDIQQLEPSVSSSSDYDLAKNLTQIKQSITS